jgi:glutamine synthetase type III
MDAWAKLAARGKELGLRFYQFSLVDLFGVMRAKLVPASRVEDIASGGAGFAPFAAWFDLGPYDGDLLAVPDPSTLIQLPWQPDVGWLACDLILDGKELKQGPRNALRALNTKLAAQGIVMKCGVECEFFLLDASAPLGKPALGDPRDVAAKPCYEVGALMRRFDVISTLMKNMEALGWGPYQADHEDANGQFEINLDYSDALTTADRVAFFKYMAKSVAEQHGLQATFMPKPFADLTGTGMHVHISLHDVKTGKNLCGGGLPANHGISDVALKFLSGLLANTPAITALTNPTINSFKRLNASSTTSGATWSPAGVTWGGNNRTNLVRVPGEFAESTGGARFELRLADGAANPYLLPAAIGGAGLAGLVGACPPAPPPCDMDMFDNSNPAVAEAKAKAPKLPKSLEAALEALEVRVGILGSSTRPRRSLHNPKTHARASSSARPPPSPLGYALLALILNDLAPSHLARSSGFQGAAHGTQRRVGRRLPEASAFAVRRIRCAGQRVGGQDVP